MMAHMMNSCKLVLLITYYPGDVVAKVLVLMMQKDEGPILSRWLLHYSGLFGIRNITIMDNGSTDRYTLELLKSAEGAGATIMWGYDTQHDFQNKGGHFGNIIQSWDHDIEYDFALPVDCDEIIAAVTDTTISTRHEDIHAALDGLKGQQCALRLDMSLFNVPGSPGWFAPVRHFHKGFVAARTLEILDNGQHEPISRVQPGYIHTHLTYLHWHNRPHAELLARTRSKLSDLVDVNDRKALKRYVEVPGAPGGHLVEILLTTEAKYSQKYAGELQVFVPDFGGVNFFRTDEGPLHWNAEGYVAAHPDIMAHDLGPLHHFIRYGFTEGRRI